ncbi:MAG: hypothetical protein K2Q26_08900 [Bdellovibrionales bacterium]|nr:hypothetical protein [Bdellovibrionales bacterium]
MRGSQIQQGVTASTQIQVNPDRNVESVLASLIQRIENATKATEDQKELARAYAAIIISQSKIPSESRSNDLVRKTWEKLSNLSTALSLTDFSIKAASAIYLFFGF